MSCWISRRPVVGKRTKLAATRLLGEGAITLLVPQMPTNYANIVRRTLNNLSGQSPPSTCSSEDEDQTVVHVVAPAVQWHNNGLHLPEQEHPVQHEDDQVRRICVWGDTEKTCDFRRRYEYACGKSSALQGKTFEIRRVQQRDGEVRFDVQVASSHAETILERLKRYACRWGWRCRFHREYELRTTLRQNSNPQNNKARTVSQPTNNQIQPGAQAMTPWYVKALTCNVDGLAGKRDLLREFAEEVRPSIMALQETRVVPEMWSLRVNGYHCFQAMARGTQVASERGVALLLQKRFNGQAVGNSSPWHLFVRVFGGCLPQPILVGSAYIPHGHDRQMVKDMIGERIGKLRSKYPHDPVIIMGDWNMKGAAVQKLASTWLGTWRVLENPRCTRHNGKQAIDHIVVSSAFQHPWTDVSARSLFGWDISDHYPVMARLGARGAVTSSSASDDSTVSTGRSRPRLRIPEKFEKGESVVHSNYWEVLREMVDGDVEDVTAQAHDITAQFEETCHMVGKANGLAPTKSKQTRRSQFFTRSTQKALRQRRERCAMMNTYLESTANPNPERRKELIEAYQIAKKKAQRKVRTERRRKWHRTVQRACRLLRTRPKAFWKWASRTAGWRLKDGARGLQPMRDSVTNLLATDIPSISTVWFDHFQQLLEQVNDGHIDPSKWTQGPPREHIKAVDEDINFVEFQRAVKALKRGKAPGHDGVPPDFLKLCALDWESNMATTLFELVRWVWRNETIPEQWHESEVVVIPKKGDLTLTTNYRGIALMPSVLKLLLTILTHRLYTPLEEAGFFVRAQCGFRSLEEAPLQFATVWETCQRRQLKGESTYLCFIDLKKAYDMVPHDAMFAKLEHAGVRGKMLRFLKGLYANSSMRVRIGEVNSNQHTNPIHLKRGLRQGCPLSPLLFNIFINDLTAGMQEDGAEVPSGQGCKNKVLPSRIPATLFADDIALLACTASQYQNLLTRTREWVTSNKMEVGLPKCGQMLVAGNEDAPNQQLSTFKLGNDEVPTVDRYSYLGIQITPDLDRERILELRFEKARATVEVLTPFLRCGRLPLRVRAMVLKAIVLPRLLYGAEIYGMCRKLTDKMQTFLNKALRAMVGLSTGAKVPNVALWRETGVPPICALAAARRARAFRKSKGVKTWISELSNKPYQCRGWTWVTGTERWLKRYFIPWAQKCNLDAFVDAAGWDGISPKVFASAVKQSIWAREEHQGNPCKSTRRYLAFDFSEHNLTLAKVPCGTNLNIGMTHIVKLRLNGIWWAKRLALTGMLPERFATECPCCGTSTPETVAHALLYCPRWTVLREQLLREMIFEAEDIVQERQPQCDPLHSVDTTKDDWIVALLLGGKVQEKKLSGWIGKHEQIVEEGIDEAEPDGLEEDADVSDSHSSQGSVSLDLNSSFSEAGNQVNMPFTPRCGAHRVALFMQVMMPLRAAIVKPLQRGRSFLPQSTSSQGPDG